MADNETMQAHQILEAFYKAADETGYAGAFGFEICRLFKICADELNCSTRHAMLIASSYARVENLSAPRASWKDTLPVEAEDDLFAALEQTFTSYIRLLEQKKSENSMQQSYEPITEDQAVAISRDVIGKVKQTWRTVSFEYG